MKTTLKECRKIAIESGKQVVFDFCGPAGRTKAIWIDPENGVYFDQLIMKSVDITKPTPCGLLVEESDHFWCENIEFLDPS